MCVSAEASFGLAGVLVPVGLYCLKKAGERDQLAFPIAAVPFFFGLQQFCEGLVWVGLGRDDVELTRWAAVVFLFFALAFWLFWIPFSAVFLDDRKKIRWVLGFVAVLGLIVGAVLFLPVASDPNGVQVTVVHHSVRYNFADSPDLMLFPQPVWHAIYLAIIVMPLVLLQGKASILYSTALVLTAVMSHTVFLHAFASIWCFASAILSLYLGYLFHHWPLRDPQPQSA